MLRRILIANRGEIAVRIIQCCREMNIETVAVYSKADKDSLHVQLATEAICIGDTKASESYLNIANILSAATLLKCDAIHPGYGFLSENSKFAKLCEDHGIVFIGPRAETIEKMGDKAAARDLMISCGVPVVPGSTGVVETAQEAKEIAETIGYPILVKASNGGGGKGMRRVNHEKDIEKLYVEAQQEAIASFGNGDVYIEKLIEEPSHIEFQILADNFGNVIHLGDRDCSIQRKNQKLIEEAPSKLLNDNLREEMGLVAVKAAQAAEYIGAGTLEFVVDSAGNYYFIEMNTRVQVEHPVTEIITNVDIIKEQIRVAAGLSLQYTQDDIAIAGHAIECRINAEHPSEGFRPSAGEVSFLHFPAGYGVRVDSALYNGYTVNPFYDSMVAKIIVHGATRLDAIKRMRRALQELVIEGIHTNTELAHLIMYHEAFVRGTYDTSFIQEHLDDLLAWEKPLQEINLVGVSENHAESI